METVEKYFKTFKISNIKNITPHELKRRYRILVQKYHPDHGGRDYQFRFIQESYKYLKVLVEQNIKNQNNRFFNNKRYLFYGDKSVYDTKKRRWAKWKGKIIDKKI